MDLVHHMPLDIGKAELTLVGNQEYFVTTDCPLWLQQWQQQFPLTVHIPPKACKIFTPLQPATWSHYLARYPNQDLTKFFIDYSLVTLKQPEKTWRVHILKPQMLMTASKLHGVALA